MSDMYHSCRSSSLNNGEKIGVFEWGCSWQKMIPLQTDVKSIAYFKGLFESLAFTSVRLFLND